MSTADVPENPSAPSHPTRRVILQGALTAVMLAGASAVAEAQTKVKPDTVKYQQQPKGDQQCDKCLQWVAPDSCKLVDGKINPKGWCTLYAAKSK